MSLDLEIIPGMREIPSPARILQRWRQLLEPEQQTILGSMSHVQTQQQPWPATEPLRQQQRFNCKRLNP
ncbi:hypothetical protein [Herpetosiphon llansteffanensis]|uniref:hypothetical protein n=1 Tax=Herpetosiphon llansteffanensis TaxID=2094568 RepID=UPI000D7D235D|nr:hypothetical protein [Herpetosiphon llansteffanensis]